jgi:hypothetical protein
MPPPVTPPRRALALAALAAGLLAVALSVSGCAGGTAPAAHREPTRTVPLETIFEAQSELFTNPGPTLDLLKHIGVDVVKVFMPWGYIAPDASSHTRPHFDATSPAAYPAGAWTQYDVIIGDARARGIGVDLALEAPAPLWATGPGVPSGTGSTFLGSWEPSAKEFGQFVTAVATRYSGHYKPPGATGPLPPVTVWSIWNEPNYGQQLAPQAIDNSTVESSPATYRSLLDAAWSALQATGHGADEVLIGEVAPRGVTGPGYPGDFSGMVPLQFIRALYCVDGSLKPLQGEQAALRGCPTTAAASKAFPSENPALFHAEGFAFHPYPQGQVPPNVPTAPDGLGAEYADLPQVPALERTLDGALAAYGSDYRFPLYDTEFGYQTNPPEKILRAISPAKAAYYENWAEYISWLDPRVVSWDQYLLGDPPPPSSFDTGIEFADGRHKATYDAFRMPVYLPVTVAANGRPLVVWGCVRPVHYARQRSPTRQLADIQFAAASSGPFRTVNRVEITDPYGYFETHVTFGSSGYVRVSWRYPRAAGGGEIHSRTVQITIR